MSLRLTFMLCAVSLASCSSPDVRETGGTTGGEPDAGVKPSPNCPQRGGSMVEIPDMQGGSYCIDQNLVTNSAYAKWLDTNPSQDLRPAVCRPESDFCDGCKDAGRSSVFFSFVPYDFGVAVVDQGPVGLGWKCADQPACAEGDQPCDGVPAWPVKASKADYPVVHVTWCDAYVYCASQEKRLCGAIGGGPLAFTKPIEYQDHYTALSDLSKLDQVIRDPSVSEYANAMTKGGRRAFPYGSTYDASLCPPPSYCAMSRPPPDYGMGVLHAVQNIPSCQGGYPGLFDLVGNAAEFIDACDVDKDSTTYSQDYYPGCVVAGGADESGAVDGWIFFSYTDSNVGFRCCADTLKP